MTGRRERASFPWAIVDEWVRHLHGPGLTVTAVVEIVAARTGFSERTVQRWAAAGVLNSRAADRVAIGFGSHPALVWPEHWAALIDDELVGAA